MRRFWAIRRVDRDYVEPTLYKSEAAARSAAASRRGYDVLALLTQAEESSAKAPDAARVRVQTVGWWDDEDGEGRYFRFVCKLDGDTPPVWPFGLIWNSAFTLAPLPTPPKAEADHG